MKLPAWFNWPQNKNPNMHPWYIILRRLSAFPFVIVLVLLKYVIDFLIYLFLLVGYGKSIAEDYAEFGEYLG